jgi:hypothetical protein
MAKNVTVTPADGDIQFENTSGTAAGRIEQNGDDLVISNAVGDVLFGDTNSDVYIGDGVNSVDLLFEQSGSIKAEDGSTGVTLTLGSSDTTLSLYAPKITNLSTQSSEATALMINGSNVVGTRELGSAAFSASTAFVAVGGDTMTGALRIQEGASDQNNTSDTTAIPSTTGAEFLKIEGGYTDGRYTTEFAKIDRGGNLPLYIRQSKSTANSFVNLARFGDHTNSVHEFEVFGSIKASGGDSGNWNTAYGWGNHASAGYLTTETYTGTVTSVTVGTGLDVSNGTTTPSITLDLSELTDMTAAINTSQDELILLDNGAERRKLFSEIFGSAAYSNTSAFASASHNHDSSYPAKTDSYISLFSDSWGNTPEGKYIQVDLPFRSGSGSSAYYVFDVFGFRDIGQMDSMVNYRVYAHTRSNGTETNDVKFRVYKLHDQQGEFFEFAYKTQTGSATQFFIYIEEDYSGAEIFGLPLDQGEFAKLTSAMISSSDTAPSGTTQVTAEVAHPSVGTTAGTYGNTANGTKIDTITIDEHGHVTNVATGATGNMTGFFVEDGDGTEVQITNAKEWKFVEGTGIDIDWTDTSTGNDSDPYDLTFAIKNNSIGIDQLNVSDGTNGQVLTTNGSGTLSFSTVTSGSSYGWSLNGTDIESGDSVALAGGLSLSGTGGTYTLTSANDNTTYTAGTGLTLTGTEFSVTANTYAAASHTHSDATTSASGFMSSTDKTKLDGIATGAEVNVQSDWNATTGDAFIQNKPTLFDGAYSSLSGVPSTFAPSSHNHDSRYYTESEMQHFMARALGWVSGYGNSAAGYVNYNFTEDAVEISGGGDDSTGGVFKAIRVKSGDKVRFTVMLKGSAASSTGLYLRLYQHNGDMPDGKTHVSNNAGASEIVVQEDDSGDTGWEENRAVPSAWTTYEHTYTAGADGYVSLVVLNWSGHGEESIYVKQPDIQFEKVNDASKLGGTDASSYLTAHPAVTEATTNLSNSGRTYIQSITLDSNGHVTGVSTGTETVTNTNTTYSAGSGLDLTSTTFSVEADLRDGITHVGKDTSNYITFDSTNSRIDFYAGGTFVARMESDGDLHIKGDVIAFSSIFG